MQLLVSVYFSSIILIKNYEYAESRNPWRVSLHLLLGQGDGYMYMYMYCLCPGANPPKIYVAK